MWVPPNIPAGGNKKLTKGARQLWLTFYNERRKILDIKTFSEVIANQGFPIALSILLIFQIDKFMQEIVIAQKEGYR